MTRIELPNVTTREGATAHAYPLQISFQTQEFIQGVMFYYAFQDMAAGEYIRTNTGNIDRLMLTEGLEKSTADQAWKILAKYQEVFKTLVFQNVLVSFCSHWDWYIRKLSGFIAANYVAIQNSPLPEKQLKEMSRIDRASIPQQLDLIETVCSTTFDISSEQKNLLREMSLVRNLGLHNRWEVDDIYLQKSACTRFDTGHIREFDSQELHTWHQVLLKTVHVTSIQIAVKFKNA